MNTKTPPKYIMTTQSADRTGIVAALTGCLSRHDGFIHELAQFGTPSSERFFSRICFSIAAETRAALDADLARVCAEFDLNTQIIPQARPTKALIMVSKFDHCLNDLIYRHRAGLLNIDIVGIVSNHGTHKAEIEARGHTFHHIPVTAKGKPQAEAALRALAEETQTELIVLARYMQILSADMCRDFSGRIINIHHSFLPGFKGAKPYDRAYERGVKLIGATAHYVTADLDEGPIIEQSVERVDHSHTPRRLVALGRDVEARTLARAVKLHSEHRVFLNGIKTVILP
ncbi:formyltetrahydrofolate deformylase [Robiginitomaculum antarcticum]|uniref:formyltetrahydrofolate deformylase n=1 Tax=Robiginitomaculum antarcticum TaxID=437507 RepID=UPI00036135E5|nr:formyltetrahydrofolate deformylase [Robiginitomaculum antarcticum]